jgi:hypothetical protein
MTDGPGSQNLPRAQPAPPYREGPDTGWIATFVLVVAAGYLVLSTDVGRMLLFGWSFTKGVGHQGTIYRLTVDFEYLGTPQRFDIVQGCSVRITRYRDNSSSYEPGLSPPIYGRKMHDGQVVAVRSPLACEGQTTSNGRVPEGVLPLMLVYPNAEKPEFAIAYLTDEAYENPLSELKFKGARIEAATVEDYLAFRARGENALARPAPGAKSIAEKAMTWDEAARAGFNVAGACLAYLRIRLPEELRDKVRAHWPEHRPRYWTGERVFSGEGNNRSVSWEPNNEIWHQLYNSPIQARSDREDDPLRSMSAFFIDDSENSGMPTRNMSTGWRQRISGALYPAGVDLDLVDPNIAGRHVVPWKRDGRSIQYAIDYRDGKTRGFGYCHNNWQSPNGATTVDGIFVAEPAGIRFFEEDKYYFVYQRSGPQIIGTF